MGMEICFDTDKSEKEIAAILQPFFNANSAKFQRIVAHVEVDGRSTKPKFPPIDLATVEPIAPENVEEFKKKHINLGKLDYDTPEAQKRLKDVRGLQYDRWEWACENLPIFINMLRVCGHSDTAIRHMLDGTPMCFESPQVYLELRKALAKLSEDIKGELGWTNVNFVITGSSVPGFSQNPVKGFASTPSKITSASKSDVDISIVGDGINRTMTGRLEAGLEEPKRCFPTTCSATTSATRFGCKNIADVSKVVEEFSKEWNAKLPGGLQFTFCEDDNGTPPWEARIDIDNLGIPGTKTEANGNESD